MNWHAVDWSKPNTAIARETGKSVNMVWRKRYETQQGPRVNEFEPRPMPLAMFPSLNQVETRRIVQSVEAGEITREEGHQRIRALRESA